MQHFALSLKQLALSPTVNEIESSNILGIIKIKQERKHISKY